ncbi:GNAT family N-acetyltransferase [bacterium]|nr:GNAT family N-acetyltransferase [bacterium]
MLEKLRIKIKPCSDPILLATLNKSVQQLHHQLYPHEFKAFNLAEIELAMKQLLANSNAFALLAEVDEVAAGYLIYFVKERPESAFQFAKKTILIDQISVEPQFRKKGIANLLLGEVRTRAHALGINELQLDFWDNNQLAREFFSAAGFSSFKHHMKLTLEA